MSYMFCETLSEAIDLEERANKEKESVLKELSYYVETSGTIGITVRTVKFPFSGWTVEADLTFNGEVVKSYPAYDMLVLDLYMLEFSVLSKYKR